jgi:hypothetical protein
MYVVITCIVLLIYSSSIMLMSVIHVHECNKNFNDVVLMEILLKIWCSTWSSYWTEIEVEERDRV